MKGFAIMTAAVLIVIAIGVGLVGGLPRSNPFGIITGAIRVQGGPAPGFASAPQPGEVTLTNLTSGAIVVIHTGENDSYSIAVPSGTYSASDETDGRARGTAGPIRVVAGVTADGNIYTQIP